MTQRQAGQNSKLVKHCVLFLIYLDFIIVIKKIVHSPGTTLVTSKFTFL